MAWYNAAWTKRIPLTIDNTKVGSGGVTSFPVLVTGANMPASGYWTVCLSTGNDIRFTAADGETLLNHELVSFSSAGTQELWVSVPSVPSASATVIYLYFGNAAASAPSAASQQAVWVGDNAVWHMNDATTSTIADSTSAGKTGTKTSANNPHVGVGIIGKTQVFDGSDDAITVALTIPFATAATVSFWMKTPQVTAHRGIMRWGTADLGFYCHYTSDSVIKLYGIPNGWGGHGAVSYDVTDIDDNATWSYWALTTNGRHVILYKQGQPVSTADSGVDLIDRTLTTLGNYTYFARFAGSLDEVRVSAVARTPADILTEYNNQSSPATFYSVGAVETKPGGRIFSFNAAYNSPYNRRYN